MNSTGYGLPPPPPDNHQKLSRCLRSVESDLAYIGNIKMMVAAGALKPEEIRGRVRKAYRMIESHLFRALAYCLEAEAEDVDE